MTQPLASAVPDLSLSRDQWVLSADVDAPASGRAAVLPAAQRGPVSIYLTGELHNAHDLAGTSDLPRHAPDADCLAAAYEHAGETVLAMLRGAFTVVIIDRARGHLLAAGDPMGARPLFYAHVGRRAFFAGDPRALRGQAGVRGTLNRAALADLLCRRHPDPQDTFFEDVRRVPAGFRVKVKSGQVRIDRFWDPFPADRDTEWLTTAEVRDFSDVLGRAVRRCSEGARVGVFLSGGLDSVSVAAVAADLAASGRQQPPLALSLGFPSPECDERPVQRAASRLLGLDQELVDFQQAVGARPLLEQSLALSRVMASPLLNAFSVPYLSLARIGRRRGVQTILTGNGGDEWWSVPGAYTADLFRSGNLIGVAKFWRAWRRAEGGTWPQLTRGLGWHSGLRPLASRALARLSPDMWNESRTRRLLASDPSWMASETSLRTEQHQRCLRAFGLPSSPGGFRVAALRLGLDHPVTLLEREESFGIAQLAGVRIASPLLDPDVVAMACRTAPALLNQNGYLKSALREYLAARLPSAGLHRLQKVLATSFFRSAVLDGQVLALNTMGGLKTLGDLGVIDRRAAEAFVRASNETSDPKCRAWDLLNTETWARAHAS